MPAGLPSSRTTMQSAFLIVLTCCAIMSTAASFVSDLRALRSAASVLKSGAEKLSSNMYSSGFLTSARAIESLCFCPPEKFEPPCATHEFSPSGRDRIKSPAIAMSAACMSPHRSHRDFRNADFRLSFRRRAMLSAERRRDSLSARAA